MQNQIRSEDQIKEQLESLKKWLDETKNEPVEEMTDFFKKRLDNYEDVHLKHWSEEYKYIATLVPEKAETLLDIGCGTGLELDEIFKLHPYLYVTGIDLAEPMLAKLKEKHPDRNLKLINADYFIYPFEKNNYDIAVSFMTLHHFKYEKKGSIYKKLYNTLNNGGFYIECDYVASCAEHEAVCLEYYANRRKKDAISDDVFVHIDIPLTLGHQIELMKTSGFNSIDVLYQNENTVIFKAYK